MAALGLELGTSCILRILGRPSAKAFGRQIALPENGFAIVAMLALSDSRELGRDHIRKVLWPGVAAPRQAGNLRQLLLRIGTATTGCPPLIEANGTSLRLATDSWQIDWVRLLDEGSSYVSGHVHPAVGATLLEGLVQEGPGFGRWLANARRMVCSRLAPILATALAFGDVPEGPERIRLAERLLECDPTNEIGFRTLMEASAAVGDRNRARKAWEDCKSRTRREFGSVPSAEARFLAQRLGLDSPPGDPQSIHPPKNADPVGSPTVIMMPLQVIASDDALGRIGSAFQEALTYGLAQNRALRIVDTRTSLELSWRGPSRFIGDETSGPVYAMSVSMLPSVPSVARLRLTHVATGLSVWGMQTEISAEDRAAAARFDLGRMSADVFSALERHEADRVRDDDDPTAFRLCAQGRRLVGTTRLESLRAARRCFRSAVRRSGEYAQAHSGLSRSLSMEWLVRGLTENALLVEALSAAQRARECDPHDGKAAGEVGFSMLYLRRHDEAIGRYKDAIALAPDDADLHADFADALLHDGSPDLALEMISTAKALKPVGPQYHRWVEASVLYTLEDYEGALAALQQDVEDPATARLMAASSAMAGETSLARMYASRVRENYPEFRIEQVRAIVPDRRPEDIRHFERGLALAGLD